MSRLCVFLTAALLYVTTVNAPATPSRSSWLNAANRVAQSTAFLDSPDTSCTAIAISEERGTFLTAGHCITEHAALITLDGHPASVVWVDHKLDLAVLSCQITRRRAIVPRFDPLVLGEEVALYGHGLGSPVARLRIGHVSVLEMIIAEHTEPYLMIDTAGLPGMSGGPIVDIEGRLVGVMQISSYVESGMAPMSVVMKATRSWW